MALSNRINAAHILRLYAWEMMRANEVLEFVNVRGENLIPIIPLEDEPDFRESGKPYLIYGYTENNDPVHEIERGDLAFRIIAKNSNQLTNITNVLSRGFRGEDERARNINEWSTSYPNSQLVGLRFLWVHTTMVESADPAEQEGGQVEGSMIIGYRYISHQTVKSYNVKTGTWS